MIHRRMYLTLIAAALLSAASAVAQSGGEGSKGGGGGDVKRPIDGSMWFPEYRSFGRPIRYCVHISPKFGYSEEQVKAMVEETFVTWTRYFDERVRESVTDPTYGPVTRLTQAPVCDATADLRFELGTTSDEIEAGKKEYTQPIAFGKRLNGPEPYWFHGYVWLANPGEAWTDRQKEHPVDWATDPRYLRLALLHEWGHIFGCEHVSGTIMDERFYLYMSSWQANIAQAMFIDQTRELYRESGQAVRLRAKPEHTVSAEGVREFFGLNFGGSDLVIEKEKNYNHSLTSWKPWTRFRITVSHEKKSRAFNADRMDTSGTMSGRNVFQGPLTFQDQRKNYSTTWSGDFRNARGERIGIQIEYNADSMNTMGGAWTLYLIKDNQRSWFGTYEEARK